MYSRIAIVALILPLFYSLSSYSDSRSEDKLTKSRALVKQYKLALSSKLKSALAEGGPTAAIMVCHSEAPKIGQELSKSSGAKVSRVSSRKRNILNEPTGVQKETLKTFEVLLKKSPDAVLEKNWQAKDGRFYYMRGITTTAVCLNCHGKNLAPEIQSTIEKFYPADNATGYELGELRGAFVVEWPKIYP